MNRQQSNAIRASMGLEPIKSDVRAAIEAGKRQAANRAAHAQLQRDIRAKRNKGGK
jgi:hypothetical protein